MQNHGALESEWDEQPNATQLLRSFQGFANKVTTSICCCLRCRCLYSCRCAEFATQLLRSFQSFANKVHPSWYIHDKDVTFPTLNKISSKGLQIRHQRPSWNIHDEDVSVWFKTITMKTDSRNQAVPKELYQVISFKGSSPKKKFNILSLKKHKMWILGCF